MSDGWCTIESDPGVFTCLCEEIGVKGVQFEEIYTLDDCAFSAVDPEKVHGLVFLFKWVGGKDERPVIEAADHGIFFANQVIQNACATQAILSVLLNAPDGKGPGKVDLGPHLTEFKEFTGMLDSESKGLAIGNSEVIRTAHNSFKHQSSFEFVQDKDDKGDDAFHFIGYICHESKIYELDGLKKGPVLVGEVIAGVPWVATVTQEIQRRIDSYSQQAASGDASAVELRFNLMAIIANRQSEAEHAILRQRHLRQRATISLVSHGEVDELSDELDDDEAPNDIPTFDELSVKEVGELKKIVESCNAEISEIEKIVESEKQRRAKWAKENARRRHDMVPLALAAMRHLARKRQLMPAYEKGKAATLKRAEEKKAASAQ